MRTGNADGPRVLAFADVRSSLVAQARVQAPLRTLHEQGLIAGYAVTDASLRDLPTAGEFDVVWLQRAADAHLADLIASRLHGAYLLDLDDHLLCRPAYLDPGELPEPESLRAALAGCAVLTTPSARLRSLLEARAGLDLSQRAHACVNAVPFGDGPLRSTGRPRALLLTQGHRLALHASRDEVAAGIAQGAARHGLPLWTLGEAGEALATAAYRAGVRLDRLSPRTWSAYHEALAGPPTLVGLAPLETRGDPDTLEFIAGKSDVKMVEFGGYGHPAVCSDAPPYRDSDLRCGRMVANETSAWAAAIDEAVAGWGDAAAQAAAIRERRGLAQVAAGQWWPAVLAARLDSPVRPRDLFSAADRIAAAARDRAARLRWRLDRRRS